MPYLYPYPLELKKYGYKNILHPYMQILISCQTLGQSKILHKIVMMEVKPFFLYFLAQFGIKWQP